MIDCTKPHTYPRYHIRVANCHQESERNLDKEDHIQEDEQQQKRNVNRCPRTAGTGTAQRRQCLRSQ
eukprot:1532887-Pyramimonas_sp.AAC.1